MYKSCFDGILSCLNGSSLLSSCFYPPVQSDSGHKTRAKALAEAVKANAKARAAKALAEACAQNYDEFCTNEKYQRSKHSNQFRFILYKLPDIDSEKKDEFGSILVKLPFHLEKFVKVPPNQSDIVDVPDPEVAVERVDHIVVSGKEERV